jgi:hypothetical protein
MWRNIYVQIIYYKIDKETDVGTKVDKRLGMCYFMVHIPSIPNISKYIVYLAILQNWVSLSTHHCRFLTNRHW